MSPGKRFTVGFISTMSWLVLFLALAATTANLIVGGLSHIGGSASAIVKNFSQSESAISSLIDKIEKGSDPKVAQQIQKNRETIEKTLASLGESSAFRGSLEKTLNEISTAILSGSNSVKVDFSSLANQVAARVNGAAKTTVISKKDLQGVVFTTLDLSKQSEAIANIKNVLHLALLLWLLWIVLVGLLFLLKGRKVIQTAGVQIFSIGILGVLAHFAIPFALEWATENSDIADYQREIASSSIDRIASPAITVGVIATVIGLLMALVPRILAKKSSPASTV